MMYLVSQPLYLTFHDVPYSFKEYKILDALNNDETIFTGRAFFDGNGEARIKINDVIQNYISEDLTYNYILQEYQPFSINDLNTNPLTDLRGKWYSKLKIICGREIHENEYLNAWFPSYFAKQNYGTLLIGQRLLTSQPQHIPSGNHDRYWANLLLKAREPNIRLTNGSDEVLIDVLNDNAYTGYYSSQQLTEKFGAGSDVKIKSSLKEVEWLHIDECNKDFYLSFVLTTGGWYSFGMNTAQSIYTKNDTMIQGVDYEEYPIISEYSETFKVRSGYHNQDEYNLLSLIVYSKYAYLYDTKLKRGYYCTVTNTSHEAMAYNQSKPKMFECELTKLSKNII